MIYAAPGTAGAPGSFQAQYNNFTGGQGVGPVGGLVGMFGGLGGFALPPLFTYSQRWTGAPTSMFLVMFLLTLVCAIWMHIVVVQLLRAHAPRSLSGKLEDPRLTQALPAH